MNKFNFNIKDQSFDTSVEELQNGLLSVVVNGDSYEVKLEDSQPKPQITIKQDVNNNTPQPPQQEKTTASNTTLTTNNNTASSNGTKVVSPLPGSIIKVLVKEGQSVKKGDVLLTFESMKMENSVQSECDGVVSKINVVPGQNVMQDDVLLIIQ